jgi:hypothetical protein
VVNDLIQTLAAIPTRVFDLGANLAERFADPCHLNGGQVPSGVSRHTTRIEIGALVARRTLHADGTEAGWASHHEWLVGMPVVALPRTIARRVAIHASGILDYFARFREEGNRSVFLARDV